MRIFRITFITFTALVALVAAVSLALHVFISRHDHQFIKDQITRHVFDATGYELQINGALDLPYTLLPTVVLQDIVLTARYQADNEALLSADSLRVTVAILPLLNKRVRIDDTTLTNAALHLEFDATGDPNWIPERPPATSKSETVVEVHSINFEQLAIRFVDQRIDVELNARIEELRLAAPASETYVNVALVAQFEDLPIRADGRINARDNIFVGLELPVSLTGTILDMAFAIDGHIDRVVGAPIDEFGFFANVHLEGSDMGAFADVTRLVLPTTDAFVIDGSMEGHPGTLVASNLVAKLNVENLELRATGRIGQLTSFDELELAATLDGDDLQSVPYFEPGYLDATDSFTISANVLGDWPTLELSDIVASAKHQDISLTASGELADASIFGGASIDLRVAGDNLSDLAAVFDLPPLDTRAYQGSGKFVGSWPQLSLADADVSVVRDDVSMSVTGSADDIFELSGLQLHVDAQGNNLAGISELNEVFGLDFPPTEQYDLTAELVGDFDELSARDLEVTGSMPGLELTFSGDIGNIAELQNVDIRGAVTIDDLSELSERFGHYLLKDVEFDLSGRMQGTAPKFDLTELSFRSGESLMHGNAEVTLADRLSLEGAITSGRFDLRPYLVTARDRAVESRKEPGERFFSSEPFNLSYLDILDLDFTFDKLQVVASGGNTFIKSASVSLQSGSVRIDPLELVREDTTVSGHLILDRSAPLAFDTSLIIENADLSTFLKDIRATEIYEGTFDLALELAAHGNSIGEVASSLDGEFAMFVSRAHIPEVNLNLRITDALLGALPWLKKENDVTINCAMSQMVARNGIVDVKLLFLDSAQLRMIGGGSIDLRSETYDLRLAPRARGARLFAHNIDLLLTGPITDPIYTTAGAVKTVASTYGKYALLGPAGLLVPTERTKKHPCMGSLREYREAQETTEAEQE